MNTNLFLSSRSVKFAVGLVFICLNLIGCIDLGGVTNSIDKATNIIDRGIDTIRTDSANWQTTLQGVANDLPKEISEIIRTDAQNLATRSIAAAGIEFRCNVDFLGNRAIQALQWLKAKLLGGTPPAPPPSFCQVAPDSIELSADPARWSKVTLAGYDLDQKDPSGKPLEMFLLNAAGQKTPVPEDRIARTTHYQVTLNLGGFGKQLLDTQASKIVVSWADKTDGYPQVAVIPWVAQRKVEFMNAGRTTFMPPRIHGDGDFDTSDSKPMIVDLSAEIRTVNASSIEGQVFMHALEPRPDRTEVSGESGFSTLYTAPANFRILDVRPAVTSNHSANITVHGLVVFSRPAGEVVERFEVQGDRDGDEAGTWTQVEVFWRQLEIQLEEIAPPWLR